jgi:16S rRNA (uracil1498-N3)-methyltransferase
MGSRRTPRLYLDRRLAGKSVRLSEPETHYLVHVLRLKRGDSVVVFNGRGEERAARVAALGRKEAELGIFEPIEPMPEPTLDLMLVQALIKAEPMDFVIQKATELGVRTIYPVETQFSVVKLDAERIERRLEHWTRKAQSACEQSGRHRPARIEPPSALAACLHDLPAGHLRLALHPGAAAGLAVADTAEVSGVCLAAGPEGGFSRRDLEVLDAAGFEKLSLGPRTLRAETAALAGCVLAQARWGDLR